VSNRKVKILHVIKSLGRGGAEMLLPETLKYHDKSRFEFHYIYFLPWKDQMVKYIEANGGKVTCLEASNNIRIFLKISQLIQYIRQHNIQLIHCHLPWAGIAGRIAAKATGVPVIYTEHNNFSRYHSLTRLASRLTLLLNQLNIPVSGDAELALRQFIKPDKIKLILNGVDTVAFSRNVEATQMRSELNIPEDHIVIATAAVFREQKRLDNFIQVAEEIAALHEKVSFIMIGDGPEREKIEELAKHLIANGRIYFVGLQQDVKPYFNITDIYLMTSDFEGLPIALLEAMSMACAPVSTGVGGIPEVIEQNVSGLLSEAGDLESLKKNVISLIKDKTKRTAMAAEARKRVEQDFSMKKMVQELEDVYHQYAKHGI
jgi:L-malate glycosyltransferase